MSSQQPPPRDPRRPAPTRPPASPPPCAAGPKRARRRRDPDEPGRWQAAVPSHRRPRRRRVRHGPRRHRARRPADRVPRPPVDGRGRRRASPSAWSSATSRAPGAGWPITTLLVIAAVYLLLGGPVAVRDNLVGGRRPHAPDLPRPRRVGRPRVEALADPAAPGRRPGTRPRAAVAGRAPRRGRHARRRPPVDQRAAHRAGARRPPRRLHRPRDARARRDPRSRAPGSPSSSSAGSSCAPTARARRCRTAPAATRAWPPGSALLALALVAGLFAGPMLPGAEAGARREVVRTALVPPLDVSQFPSPLPGFPPVHRAQHRRALRRAGPAGQRAARRQRRPLRHPRRLRRPRVGRGRPQHRRRPLPAGRLADRHPWRRRPRRGRDRGRRGRVQRPVAADRRRPDAHRVRGPPGRRARLRGVAQHRHRDGRRPAPARRR